jgi:MFS family permease
MKISQILSFCIIMLFYILHNMLSLNPDMERNKMLIFGTLALLGVIIGLLLTIRLFLSKKKLLYTRKQVAVVVLLILFTLISSFLFAIKGGNLKAIFMLISCLGAIIVGLINPLTERRLSVILMLIVLTQQFNVLLQGIKSLIAYSWWFPAFNVYFSSTNGTAQFAATSMAIVLLVYSLGAKKSGFLQTVFLANIGIGTAIILLSASRGDILALVLATIYWLWKTTSLKALLFNKKTYKYAIGIVLLLVLIMNTMPSVKLQLTDYFKSIDKVQSENFLQSEGRSTILVEALGQIFSDSSSFFGGQGDLFSTMPQTGFTHAHNSYIEIVRNLGIFPLLLLILLLITAIASNKSSPYIMAALIIIMIRAFFDDTLLWTNFGEFFLFWPVVLLTYRQYEKHSAN